MNKTLLMRFAGTLSRAFVLATSIALAGAAVAQGYPDRPIHFVVPFAAGGGSDVIVRLLAEPLSQRLGQPIIVDNRPGAGATTGAAYVANAPADGYTLLYGTPGPQIINPYLMGKLPYDPERDFAPVSRLGIVVSVLVVNPNVPAKNMKELIELAKAEPGRINFASAGVGATSHLAGEYLKTVAGIDIVHVPYKGTGAALQDLLAGNVQMSIDSIPAFLPYIKAGTLRPLAVTSVQRSPSLPDVPPIADFLAGFDASPMNYVSVRAGTPKPIVERLNREFTAVLAMPAIRERLIAMGVIPSTSTPEELGLQIRSEAEKWKKVIEVSGAKAE